VVVSIDCPAVVVRYVILKSVRAGATGVVPGAAGAAGRFRVRWANNAEDEMTSNNKAATMLIPKNLFLMTFSSFGLKLLKALLLL
jgi:hypothetical protein